MDSILKKVLSLGNKEQNQHYPPSVFQQHFVLATDWLLDRVAEIFPNNNGVVEIAKPFLKVMPVDVKGGVIPFQPDHRNTLRIGILATEDGTEHCCDEIGKTNKYFKKDPLAPSVDELQTTAAKKNCKMYEVRLVEIGEWDRLTRHPYKGPTYQKPIACIFDGVGIKICPADITRVEMSYLRIPKAYQYNYTSRPDDTYEFNPAGSVESEWTTNAQSALFKGVSTLYGMYVRDNELRDYNVELKKIGIF